MTKNDLENGMILETIQGAKYLVLNHHFMSQNGLTCVEKSFFTDDLKDKSNNACTIVKIFKTRALFLNKIFDEEYLELIWERPPLIKFSPIERCILKNIDKKYKYIVRDNIKCKCKCNISIFENKPLKGENFWYNLNGYVRKLDMFDNLFQNITWDNEPLFIDDYVMR